MVFPGLLQWNTPLVVVVHYVNYAFIYVVATNNNGAGDLSHMDTRWQVIIFIQRKIKLYVSNLKTANDWKNLEIFLVKIYF